MTAQLWVDDRYRGTHGIGRYASEVLSRLAPGWNPLGLSGKPGGPVDALHRLPARGQDVVYSPGYAGFVSSRRQILTVHDLIHLRAPWPGRAKYLAYYTGVLRPAVRRAGVVLTVSETSRDAIREWLDDDRVEVTNGGIGCSTAFSTFGEVSESSEPYVQYVGNLRSHKNVDVVLRAVATVDGVRLRMLIPEAETARATERIDALGIGSRVELMNGLADEELAASYRGASATVMPSLLEGFGLPALESVRCGTPVLYWRGCAAVRETVGDRGTAVDDAADVDAWAQALADSVATRRRVTPPDAETYSWDRTAEVVCRTLSSHGDV